MKNFFCLLSGLGLVSILIIGTSVNSVHANNQKSPLRGVWSFSQFAPAVSGFGTPTPIPTAVAGTFIMKEDNSFTGHVVLDTPLPLPQPTFEVDFNGSCTFRQADIKNGMDCTLDAPGFGLIGVGRFCVAMGKRGGGVPVPSLAIPATLHDALMARLDRLNTAKEIAQLGATVGREFSYELLHALSPLEEPVLQHGLRQLVETELVYQRGMQPQATYVFKHALIQDTAYQSLLKSGRRQLHQQIAQVLADQFPETVEIQPELLAHHYTEAGLKEQAIPYWQQAGQRASQRSAHIEAINNLTKGLGLLKTLPDTPERAQQELTLQLTLGPPLQATKGYGAPAVERAYTRARELCRQIGETSQLFPVLRGLAAFYVGRAEHRTAHELAEQQLHLAQSVQDPALFLEAHHVLGQTFFFLGEFAMAREHCEQGIALYDPQQHRSHIFLYGQDPGIVCLAIAAWALWYLGYPDQALKRSHEALTLAQELSHPFMVAYALNSLANVHLFRREEKVTQRWSEALIALSREQGFPYWLARGTIPRGWVLAEQGQREEGIAQIRQGLAAARAIGTELNGTYYLALLAEAYGKTGQTEEGLTVLAEALAVVRRSGDRHHEAELYRLKGELLLQSKVEKWKVESGKSKVESRKARSESQQ